MADFEVRGGQQLQALARRLEDAGRRDLRNELLRGIRTSGKKVIPVIRTSAQRLPRSGGLADRVASQPYSVSTSLTGASARVRLQGKGMKELRDIDAGRLRHPVWGNRDVWRAQTVPAGFFTKAIASRAPRIRSDIQHVMGDVARKVTGGFLG